jgi:hypothetical protein
MFAEQFQYNLSLFGLTRLNSLTEDFTEGFSHPGWQDRRMLLQVLLKTVEIGVSAITIEYFFPADSAAGTQRQPRDAYWDNHRKLC